MNCPRCNKPIDEHEAGPETDACVAVVVMGSNEPVYKHPVAHIDPVYTDDGFWVCHPEYEKGDVCKWEAIPFSSSIADAWKVVEKVNQDNAMNLRWYNPDGRTSIFSVSFGFGKKVIAEAKTAELAICRAALKCHLSNS